MTEPVLGPSCQSAHEKRVEARFNLLKETAKRTCAFLSRSLDAPVETFFFDEDALCACVKAYFDHVQGFKTKQGFGPNDLINPSKQATFMVQAILHGRPIQAVANVPDTIHHHLANDIFALRVAMNILQVRYEDIPPKVQDDILYAFRNDEHLESRLLILVMLLIEEAYGRRRRCRGPTTWWRCLFSPWRRLASRLKRFLS